MLLVCWGLVLASALLLGERSSSFSNLKGDVASGAVREVRVVGGLSPRADGYAVVEVHWQRGIFKYSTRVIEARPRSRARRASVEGVTAVIGDDVGARLAASRPGLRVIRGERFRTSTELLGQQLPGWMSWPVFALSVSTLLLLALGPEPWRATRWAWFWLLGLAPPAGILAFLLLSGATSLVAPPRDGARRLTGGWAFLLFLVLGAALDPAG